MLCSTVMNHNGLLFENCRPGPRFCLQVRASYAQHTTETVTQFNSWCTDTVASREVWGRKPQPWHSLGWASTLSVLSQLRVNRSLPKNISSLLSPWCNATPQPCPARPPATPSAHWPWPSLRDLSAHNNNNGTNPQFKLYLSSRLAMVYRLMVITLFRKSCLI